MSESSPIFAVILAAGKGTRMKSNRAKVLHTLCGVPMVNYVIEATRPLVPQGLFVVVGRQAELVEAVLPEDAKPVLQEEQRGPGDAVRVALAALEEEVNGVLLVVNGDGPLISDRTLGELVERHSFAGVGATVLVAELEDPSGLGRVVEDAGVVRIVEERDAIESERQVRLVNLGLYAFKLSEIRDAIGGLTSENKSGELYLTDVVALIRATGATVQGVDASAEHAAVALIRSTDEEKQQQVAAVRAFQARHAARSPDALAMLQVSVDEMNRRYIEFRSRRARSLQEYNDVVELEDRLPWWLLVLDEYADLTSDPDDRKAIEALLKRIAQKGRAAGIHHRDPGPVDHAPGDLEAF